jgi:hypothetical protein
MAEPRVAETMLRAPLAHSARLLFGVFAAPFAWAVQLAASFALAATSCFTSGVARTGGRVTGASHAALVVIAIACFAVAVVGLVVVMRERSGPRDASPRHASRSRALAEVGVLSSGLFLAAIGYSLVMLALAPHCPG